MIFIDSNVPMYLVGEPHRNRDRLEHFLRNHPDRVYVTSAEVYQEILHRYAAIDRREAIDDAFDLLDAFAEDVFSVDAPDVRRARDICVQHPELSARDCLHLAVMEDRGIETILSCDRAFDQWSDVERRPDG